MSSERIDRLEERLVWLQRHVTEQDKVMLELSDELARLRVEMVALRNRQSGGEFWDAMQADERPPHY